MARINELPGRVAANIRAEMAVQRKTAVELAAVLSIGHRAALRRLNGAFDFSLAEIEKVASWLGVSISELITARSVEAVA